MSKRVFNFSPGPSTLPLEVLKKAQEELLNFNQCGMSIMEMSHRSSTFEAVIQSAESRLRSLMTIPENYTVLFLQGGASHQFAMVPMNLIQANRPVDMVLTGAWSEKADQEIGIIGSSRIVASGKEASYMSIPELSNDLFDPNASYAYITSNNTIAGTQFHEFPDTPTPLVADMSSDILCRPIDVSTFGLIFAGAQKNMGPAGVTVVIIRNDLLDRVEDHVPTILQYRSHAKAKSLYNTCPTFAIYMLDLVFEWIQDRGGLSAMQQHNIKKAQMLYDVIDGHDAYYCPVDPSSRSIMNVVFRFKGNDEEKEAAFVQAAENAGLSGLKGHRSVGGLRASIYNAMSLEGVAALCDFMQTA